MREKFCNILITCSTIRQVWMLLPKHESDEPHWTERCRPRLILSEEYNSAVVDAFAEVVKVTNLTGLRDAELA